MKTILMDLPPKTRTASDGKRKSLSSRHELLQHRHVALSESEELILHHDPMEVEDSVTISFGPLLVFIYTVYLK